MSFADADLYGGIHGNQFIADLMPKQPLYVNMLPQAAQDVIGQPNVVGKPALEMLKNEGFRWNGHVDIFDAAPSVDIKIDDVTSVKNSKLAEIIGLTESDEDENAMLSNSDVTSFKTVYSGISVEKGGVRIPRATLKALELNLGDSIRYLLV
jgi:arginine N-succinyltransferase